jgi:NADH-quinone oxidoreductase subunit L
VLGLIGIATAYWFYLIAPGIPGMLAARFNGLYRFVLNKWYFDEFYNAVIVQPLIALSRELWHVGDEKLIDGSTAFPTALPASRRTARPRWSAFKPGRSPSTPFQC